MGNHIKGCGCQQCRKGMHTKYGSVLLQKLVRKVRRDAKEKLRRGEEPDPCASRGYTD